MLFVKINMAAVENFLTNNHGIAAFGQQGAATDVPRATFHPPITPSDSSVCRVSRQSDYGDILKIMGVCDQSNSTAVYIIVAANNDALTINFVGNQIVIPNFRFHAGCSHAAWYEFRRIVQQTFPEFLRMYVLSFFLSLIQCTSVLICSPFLGLGHSLTLVSTAVTRVSPTVTGPALRTAHRRSLGSH